MVMASWVVIIALSSRENEEPVQDIEVLGWKLAQVRSEWWIGVQ